MYLLQYSTTRSDVWRWYWRAWVKPAGLWRYHVIIGVTFAAVWVSLSNSSKVDPLLFAIAAAVAIACCILVFPLWPQLKYKPQMRTLEVDDRGYKTKIGDIQGHRTWSEIREIERREDAVVITTRQGNALLIPTRAFESAQQRIQFITDVTQWHIRYTT